LWVNGNLCERETLKKCSVSEGCELVLEGEAYYGFKVCVLGASGGIGQSIALLLKMDTQISRLALYDIVNTQGIAADLAHVSTQAHVTSHNGPNELKSCLDGADIILIATEVTQKPGMTQEDLFNSNASIVRDLADAAAQFAPKAVVAIIANPVNSLVPIASEVFKQRNVYDPLRIFGVSTLDVLRTNAIIAEAKKLDVASVNCPVIGGSSGITIIPVISQCKPAVSFPPDELKKLTERIQEAGTEVVKAKAGAGSATLSIAYAGYFFARNLLKALSGEQNVVQCTYVKSNVVPVVDYFSTPVLLGKSGVEKIFEIGTLSTYEQELLEKAIPELKKNIETGVQFFHEKK